MDAIMQSDVIIYKSQMEGTMNETGSVCKTDSLVVINKTEEYWYSVTNVDGVSGWCIKSSAFSILGAPLESNVESEKVDYKATANKTISYRANPDMKFDISGSSIKGDDLHITQKTGTWYYVEGKGWMNSTTASITLSEDSLANISSETKTDSEEDNKSQFTLSENYDYNDFKHDPSIQLLRTARGIFGMPYQYMDICDPKLQVKNEDKENETVSGEFGRKYAEKLVQNMPLLLITPGRPKFMKKFNTGDKANVLSALAKNDESTLSSLLNNANGKFYSLDFAYDTYYKVVNPMLKNIARLLNIQNKEIDGKALSSYDWANFRDDHLTGFISSKESVAFYIDSETQIQESFTNTVGQSSLSSSMNQLSDISREIQFLLGSTSGVQFEAFKKENYDTTKASLDSFVNKFSSILPGSLSDRLTEGALTVAAGGKLIFPEIWNDSEFSKSYDVSVKLRTPDPNPFSIYMDLFVPLCHLMALVAPVQLNGNGYTSPFLVRGYYKGMFDIDMGIITNMGINKGDKGSWTLDGLPTTIDITFTIKELYNIFSLTPENKIVDMVTNTAEMDYLANLCGININNVDIQRSLKYYYYNLQEGVVNKITHNHFLGAQAYISNVMGNIFGK